MVGSILEVGIRVQGLLKLAAHVSEYMPDLALLPLHSQCLDIIAAGSDLLPFLTIVSGDSNTDDNEYDRASACDRRPQSQIMQLWNCQSKYSCR